MEGTSRAGTHKGAAAKTAPGSDVPFIPDIKRTSADDLEEQEYLVASSTRCTLKIRHAYEGQEEEEDADDDEEEDPYEGNPRGPLLKKLLVEPFTTTATALASTSKGTSKGGCPPTNVPQRAMAQHHGKLERKDSSGDLMSRLKSRKTLGVGENQSSGEIPRSKTEQMLGYDEHLHMKLPKGYWNWQRFLVLFLGIQGLFIVTCPEKASEFGLVGVDLVEKHVPSQYYGATNLALAYFLWEISHIKDKRIMRAALLTLIIYLGFICLVDFIHALKNGIHHLYSVKGLNSMGIRIGILLICTFYLYRIGTPTSGARKSPSVRKSANNE